MQNRQLQNVDLFRNKNKRHEGEAKKITMSLKNQVQRHGHGMFDPETAGLKALFQSWIRHHSGVCRGRK